MKRIGLFVLVILAVGMSGGWGTAQVAPVPTSPPSALIGADRYIRSTRLGIAHISSAEVPVSEERYRNALLLGAGWNRWPIYWDRVETQPGQLNWSAYDRLVNDDLRHGLKINAILLGHPAFYAGGSSIAGLNAPIFADGSDTPRDGKSLNPDNHWANFVFQAVTRYKPGGILARQQGWQADDGIRIWEIWNEPDYRPFWQGTITDYARLLKVAYIVAKQADPNARIMFGGLLFGGDDNWLARVLAIYENDPLRDQYNWYMDIVAVHSYTYPWRSGWLVRWVKQTLKAYGLKRSIWLNESGAPVWDDYPGPIWAANPIDHQLRASTDQQAAFFIQSTAYAWAEGADVVFYFQLYDDCGDQPPGTNFSFHNGELCATGQLCAGDAFGLFRNKQDSACFSHHPFPGTPRPAAAAFRLMAEIFGTGPFDNPKVETLDAKATRITFDRLTTNERISVVWNRTFEPVTVSLTAGGTSAMLYSINDSQQIVPDADGFYQITLPPAVPDGYPFLEPGDLTAIGGLPFIIVERFTEGLASPDVQPLDGFSTPPPTPRVPLAVTPGAILGDPPRPTVDPSVDKNPPSASVEPLPEVSGAVFVVKWSGQDDSGIDHYLVWVRVNGGSWQPWLETSRTEAQYTGEAGSTYEFAVWAVDLGGNWSPNTDLSPQAVTRVE